MGSDIDFLADADKRQAEILVNTGDEVRALVESIYRTPRPVIERTIAELKKAGG
jgi:hypothetical protein